MNPLPLDKTDMDLILTWCNLVCDEQPESVDICPCDGPPWDCKFSPEIRDAVYRWKYKERITPDA